MAREIVSQIEQAIESESLAEFVREYVEGGKLSHRGLTAMCGVDNRALFRGGDLRSGKLAKKLAAHGFEGGDLKDGFPPIAVWLVVEYFAYESRAEAGYAKAIAGTFGSLGVKAAFKDASEAIAPTPIPAVRKQHTSVEYIEAARTLEDLADGTLKALLRDTLVDDLELQRNNLALPASKTRYTIVKVRARSLGYSEKQIGNGNLLGRFVKGLVQPAYQEQIGRYPVWHYEMTKALDEAIHGYFGKVLSISG